MELTWATLGAMHIQAILWAANALLYLSIVPYIVACCTGRSSSKA